MRWTSIARIKRIQPIARKLDSAQKGVKRVFWLTKMTPARSAT